MTREQLRAGLDLFDQLDRLKEMRERIQGEHGFSPDEKVLIVKTINAAINRTETNIDDL